MSEDFSRERLTRAQLAALEKAGLSASLLFLKNYGQGPAEMPKDAKNHNYVKSTVKERTTSSRNRTRSTSNTKRNAESKSQVIAKPKVAPRRVSKRCGMSVSRSVVNAGSDKAANGKSSTASNSVNRYSTRSLSRISHRQSGTPTPKQENLPVKSILKSDSSKKKKSDNRFHVQFKTAPSGRRGVSKRREKEDGIRNMVDVAMKACKKVADLDRLELLFQRMLADMKQTKKGEDSSAENTANQGSGPIIEEVDSDDEEPVQQSGSNASRVENEQAVDLMRTVQRVGVEKRVRHTMALGQDIDLDIYDVPGITDNMVVEVTETTPVEYVRLPDGRTTHRVAESERHVDIDFNQIEDVDQLQELLRNGYSICSLKADGSRVAMGDMDPEEAIRITRAIQEGEHEAPEE